MTETTTGLPRRVLVTGATGQVGRALAEAAWPAGLVPDITGRDRLDLADPEGAARVVASGDYALVINPAAYTAVDQAEQEEALATRVNAEGPGALARACHRVGIPIIHLSTDYVFDGRKTGPYVEDDPVGPLGAYGRSKLAGEIAVRAACPQHLILRTAWVFSAHGKNFVRTMLRLAAEKPALRVVADQHGCPTAAHDIARVLVALASALVLDGRQDGFGTYHFAGAGPTTWHGFADAIVAAQAAQTGRRPPVEPITTADFPTPAARPANSVLATDRLTAAFGLEPRPWRETLPEVLAALRA